MHRGKEVKNEWLETETRSREKRKSCETAEVLQRISWRSTFVKCANPWWLEASGDRRFFIACGKCLYCRIQRRKLWTIRMLHERESWQDACFITLTYNQENLPSRGLKRKDLQNFFKRLRKRVTPLRYFACGEYGENPDSTHRPHYHAIVFGLARHVALKILPDVWGKGIIDVGEAEEDSIRYVAGYIDKKWMAGDQRDIEYGGRIPPFQSVSQKIGLEWLKKNYASVVEDGIVFRGEVQALPRYYFDKIKEIDPIAHAYMCDERVLLRLAREADETLELLPETGGKNFLELTVEERDYLRASRKQRGLNMQANLKAKASIYALKRQSKEKNL